MTKPTPIATSREGERISPQRLFTTLFGDFWLRSTARIPSRILTDVAAEFGASEAAARAALNRLIIRRTLDREKVGRNTFYGLTPAARDDLIAGARRISNFAADQSWDGTWTVVAFTLREEQRNLRHMVRKRLHWRGFAPLFDGLWVSPRPAETSLRRYLIDLGVADVSVLSATEVGGPTGRELISAWNVEGQRRAYDDFIAKYEPLLTDVRAGLVNASTALVQRTLIMDAYRGFARMDPGLPEELLPKEWPRRAARDLWIEIYESLGDLATVRIRQIMQQYDPRLADAWRPRGFRLGVDDSPGL
ncbi:PaaX family transcriptional regulator [Pseudonocardia sp. DLS-67]